MPAEVWWFRWPHPAGVWCYIQKHRANVISLSTPPIFFLLNSERLSLIYYTHTLTSLSLPFRQVTMRQRHSVRGLLLLWKAAADSERESLCFLSEERDVHCCERQHTSQYNNKPTMSQPKTRKTKNSVSKISPWIIKDDDRLVHSTMYYTLLKYCCLGIKNVT